MATQDAAKKTDLEFQFEEIEESKNQNSLLEEDVAASLISEPTNKSSAIPDAEEFELEIIAKPDKSSGQKIAPEPKEKTAAPLLELGEEELAEATRINSTQMLQDLPDLSVMGSEVQKQEMLVEESDPGPNNNELGADQFSLENTKEGQPISKDSPADIADELEKLSAQTAAPFEAPEPPLPLEENATTVLKLPPDDLAATASQSTSSVSDKIEEERDNVALESLISEEQEEKFDLNAAPEEKEKFPETFKVSLPTTSESPSPSDEKSVVVDDNENELNQEIKENEVGILAPPPQSVTPIPPVRKEVVKSPIRESVHYEYDENEMLKLQSTIRHLREERDHLIQEGEKGQEIIRSLEKDKLTYKAELDELKIENSILKKRHANQTRELNSELSIVLEKKAIYEAKVKQLQLEIHRLNEKVMVDVNKVRSKEKELEGHLEILTMDSASQIQARDQKIRELKRKIDTLEFNMNNAIVNEKKWRDDRVLLESKLHKVIKSLKDSLKNIEEDIALDGSVHELPRKKAL